MLSFDAITDVGCRREHNEDAVFCDPEHGLFIVADGVGGQAAGEVASALAVESIAEAGDLLHHLVMRYAEKPGRMTRNMVLEGLDEVVQQASERVYNEAEIRGQRGMSTTLVVMVTGGGAAFLAHVGDSRAYLIRNGKAEQLTDDHSMVNELIRGGYLKEADAARSPYRNVITRAVGHAPTVQPDVLSTDILPGDRILLCSDGLTDPVPHDLMAELAAIPTIGHATRQLIDAALERGGPDNISALLVDPEASPQADAAAARARVLEELFLFEDLPFHARLRVGRICEEIFATPDQPLVTEAHPGRAMYVVVQGNAIVSHQGVELARLGPGEHFGELSLADALPRSATVTANGFCSLIAIYREHLEEFCRREPELGNQLLWKLLRTVGGRLRDANAQVAELTGVQMPEPSIPHDVSTSSFSSKP
jgi:serine/threonine protein phosphatase PrpC/CRP-like cAMP-binding protein